MAWNTNVYGNGSVQRPLVSPVFFDDPLMQLRGEHDCPSENVSLLGCEKVRFAYLFLQLLGSTIVQLGKLALAT
jgi:hypothetical protein